MKTSVMKMGNFSKPVLLCAVGILTITGTLQRISAETAKVRTGIFEDNPKMFTDAKGNPKGIFVDILKEIADKEGWSIEYVKGTLAECLKNLESGKIDLLPNVLYSEEREKKFFLNRIPALSDWLIVYEQRGSGINHLDDLDKKRVAVVDQSIDEEVFNIKELQFGITPQIITAPGCAGCMSLVKNGKADAAVVSRFFAHSGECPENVTPTGIILHPAGVYFAVSNYQNKKLLDAIDKNIAAMKNDFGSAYYKSLRRWMSEGRHQPFFPPIKGVALREVVILIISIFIIVFLLQKGARLKLELRHKTVLLQESVSTNTKTPQEMDAPPVGKTTLRGIRNNES